MNLSATVARAAPKCQLSIESNDSNSKTRRHTGPYCCVRAAPVSPVFSLCSSLKSLYLRIGVRYSFAFFSRSCILACSASYHECEQQEFFAPPGFVKVTSRTEYPVKPACSPENGEIDESRI